MKAGKRPGRLRRTGRLRGRQVSLRGMLGQDGPQRDGDGRREGDVEVLPLAVGDLVQLAVVPLRRDESPGVPLLGDVRPVLEAVHRQPAVSAPASGAPTCRTSPRRGPPPERGLPDSPIVLIPTISPLPWRPAPPRSSNSYF